MALQIFGGSSGGPGGGNFATKVEAKKGLALAVVDAGGGGTHTTLADAIAAVANRGEIHVISDLTITDTVVFGKACSVYFHNGVRLNNNGPAGTDTFASSIPIGSAGSIADVRIYDPYIQRAAGATGNAGRAFNFHAALSWTVWRPIISGGHDTGLWFDASPFPAGQGSHNTVYEPQITSCVTGIRNTGNANINNVYSPHIYGGTLMVWHESGLNLNIIGARIENLGTPVTTELVRVDAPRLFMPAMHIEGNASANPIKVNAGGSIFGYGDVYVYNGGGPNLYVIDPQAGPCDLNVSNGGRVMRSAVKPEKIVRTTPNATSVDFITEYVGYDTVGGAEVSAGGPRSDRVWRLVPRTTDPAAATTTTGDVHAFTTTSGQTLLRVKDGATHRQLVRVDHVPSEKKLPDISTGATKTIHRALVAQTITSLILVPDAFVAWDASNFWTIGIEEWNGNAKVGDIVTAWVQGAQVPLSATSISLGSYALAAGRHVRLKFTPTGAPPAWSSPLVQLLYIVA